MIENDMEKWEIEGGVAFLKKLGLQAGQVVLDFGCRVGHYSIPAAKVVGDSGVVYAVDKEQQVLDSLSQKATEVGLQNIETINTSGDVHLDLNDDLVDVVLLYDVLHYFDKYKREELYMEMWRILKDNGLLSVYPKHTKEDSPMDTFKELGIDGVKKEIEAYKFIFEKKYCDTISHDNGLNYGCVLNFRKVGGQ